MWLNAGGKAEWKDLLGVNSEGYPSTKAKLVYFYSTTSDGATKKRLSTFVKLINVSILKFMNCSCKQGLYKKFNTAQVKYYIVSARCESFCSLALKKITVEWVVRCRESSVGIATSYGLEDGVGVRIPMGQEFSLLHAVKTGSGVHPTSYIHCVPRALSSGGKAAGAWSFPLTSN
jgi:hypothetical protein